MNSMYDRVKAYIEKNCMLEGIGRVVVGLSGGADSVCLLLMLKKYITETRKGCGTQLMAVHVHHGIRGAEADSDAAFCKELCEEQGIEYREYCYDVPRLAKERGCGEEEMGRLLRYSAFRENIDNLPMGIKGVAAVAHHRNDQAETVLFHIARGSSVAGTRGMEPAAGGIIRPLLCVSKKEIEKWLSDNNISYCTDQTNFEDTYARNAIRLRVIPYLEEHVNVGTVSNICKYAERMAQIDDYIKMQTSRAEEIYVTSDSSGIHVKNEIVNEHPVICKSVIYDILKKLCGAKDLEDKHAASCVALYEKQSGRSISLPKGVIARREYDGIVFANMCNNRYGNAVSRQGDIEPEYELLSSIIVPDTDEAEHGSFSRLVNDIIDKNLMNDNCTKYFDYGKIKHYIAENRECDGLVIRHRAMGDYMIIGYAEPQHREKRKKIKEIFIDSKLPAEKRPEIWLCAIGNRVLWAAGVRRCAEFLVDRDTKELFKLELKQKEK